MNIIIVDDNKEFRESLTLLIQNKLGYSVVATFSDGIKFYKNLYNYEADVILMDISMPGDDGYETTKKVFWEKPNLKIIAITMFTEKAYLQKLIEAGFKGCVYKSKIYSELKQAIDEVYNGNLFFPNNIIPNDNQTDHRNISI